MSASVWTRAVWGALSLLVVGVVFGMVLHHSSLLHRQTAVTAEDHHRHALNVLRDDLELDDDQFRQIDSLLQVHSEVLERTWQELHERLGAAVDTVHRDIEALLSEEQRAAFRAWAMENGDAPVGGLHR